MTEIQFNKIKERLSKWREERHSTYENQQAAQVELLEKKN